MFHFVPNFFDSILCARFMHVVVYSCVSLIFIIVTYPIEWPCDQVLIHQPTVEFLFISTSQWLQIVMLQITVTMTCGINMYVFILGV